jgi:hypothetical protein
MNLHDTFQDRVLATEERIISRSFPVRYVDL